MPRGRIRSNGTRAWVRRAAHPGPGNLREQVPFAASVSRLRRHGGSRGLTKAPPDRAELRELRRALRDACARYAASATEPDPETGETRPLALTATQGDRGLLRAIRGPAARLADRPDDLRRRHTVFAAIPSIYDQYLYSLAARMAGGGRRLRALREETAPDLARFDVAEPLTGPAVEAARNLAAAERPARRSDAPTRFMDPALADLIRDLLPVWQRITDRPGGRVDDPQPRPPGAKDGTRKASTLQPWLADLFAAAGWPKPTPDRVIAAVESARHPERAK